MTTRARVNEFSRAEDTRAPAVPQQATNIPNRHHM